MLQKPLQDAHNFPLEVTEIAKGAARAGGCSAKRTAGDFGKKKNFLLEEPTCH